MTHYAGQMLPFNHSAAVSPYWTLANGRFVRASLAGDYHKNYGFIAGVQGIYLLRLPPGALTGQNRWLVLLRDDPTQPNLPADTPNVKNLPTAAPALITINNIGATQTSPVPVSGLTTSGTQLQAASNVNGVIGGFTALTTTGTSFSGSVTMAPGTNLRIRVRVASATYNYVDSNPFTVTAAAGDPDEPPGTPGPPSRPQLPQRPKRGG